MPSAEGFWFVCRSLRDGPLSKRVRRISAPSILAWFQWQIDEARTSAAPQDVASAELGGVVDDLAALFVATKEKILHTPRSTVALRKMLRDLRTANDAETVLLDDHSLRVLCKEGDSSYTYSFFDDAVLEEMPSQFAWLLHDTAQLPGGEAAGSFAPPDGVATLTPAGAEADQAVFACFFASHNRGTLPGTAVRFEGVSLPGLAAHLQKATPAGDSDAAAWPVELRLLRALVEQGDQSVTPALQRTASFPVAGLRQHDTAALGCGEHAAAKAEFLAATQADTATGDPAKTVVNDSPHAAILCAHLSEELGYEQWLLFDNAWASAHAALAASILRSALAWDPCGKLKSSRPSKAEPLPKAPKRRAPAPPRDGAAPAPKKRPRAKMTIAAGKQEHNWSAGLGGRTEADAIPYRPTLRFADGEAVLHPKFGLGFVSRAELAKCEIVFADGPRLFVHAVGL